MKPDKPAQDRVLWHLDNWRRWMRASNMGLGLPTKSPAIGISHSADFDQLAGQADRWAARAVDAIISDLRLLERDAVHHAYLETKWQHRMDVEPVLVIACESIRLALNRKGVV